MPPPANSIQHLPFPNGPLRIVQLTDTHLCREAGGELLGMDTDHSLAAVIELARSEHPKVDLLLCTGDLADKGAASAYRRLRESIRPFACPSFWLPGNHDSRSGMAAAVGGGVFLCEELRAGPWQVLLLDSQVPGEVGGALGSEQLARLDRALEGAGTAGLHTLVCLHHHPVPIHCAWLDEQVVADADALFEVLDRHAGVRALLWGHIHQEVDRQRNGVRLLGSPSTCVQFMPGSTSFRLDPRSPGYRWLDLHADGRLETGVSRVTGVTFEVDLDSRGYS